MSFSMSVSAAEYAAFSVITASERKPEQVECFVALHCEQHGSSWIEQYKTNGSLWSSQICFISAMNVGNFLRLSTEIVVCSGEEQPLTNLWTKLHSSHSPSHILHHMTAGFTT